MIRLYHISFLRKVSFLEALWSHPHDVKLALILSKCVLSKVVPLTYVLQQTKFSNLYPQIGINPDFETSSYI